MAEEVRAQPQNMLELMPWLPHLGDIVPPSSRECDCHNPDPMLASPRVSGAPRGDDPSKCPNPCGKQIRMRGPRRSESFSSVFTLLMALLLASYRIFMSTLAAMDDNSPDVALSPSLVLFSPSYGMLTFLRLSGGTPDSSMYRSTHFCIKRVTSHLMPRMFATLGVRAAVVAPGAGTSPGRRYCGVSSCPQHL